MSKVKTGAEYRSNVEAGQQTGWFAVAPEITRGETIDMENVTPLPHRTKTSLANSICFKHAIQ